MIDYKIYSDGNLLLDFRRQGYALEEAKLTRELKDRFFDGDIRMTVLPDHPHALDILPRKSVIRAYSNGKEIFIGDAVPEKQNKSMKKTYVCSSAIGWLKNVPDLFSNPNAETDGTDTLENMFNRIFCEPTENPANLTGYNAYVSATRRLYRGDCEIEADIEYTAVDTIYAHLKKWIDEQDGYVKITLDEETGLHYIHILANSGTVDGSFYALMGRNVADFNASFTNLKKIATGICPVGKDGDTLYWLDGTGTITETTGFPNDTDLKTVWCTNAKNTYGEIIVYREYDVSDVSAANRYQHIYDKTVEELTALIAESVSYEVAAIDPRLLGENTSEPELGNFYPSNIPILPAPANMRLTKIVTDMVRPSGGSVTLGENRDGLSDYASGATKTAASAITSANIAKKTADTAQKTANAAATPAQVAEAIAQSEGRVADYIEETGTSGDWEYEKYKSGAVECRATSLAVSMGTWATWISDLIWSTGDINYPFTFANADDMDVDVTVTNKSGTTEINGLILIAIKSTTKCQIRFVRKTAASTMYVNVRIRGMLATN